MKIVPYHENYAYSKFMLEIVRTRIPDKVALDFNSIMELHSAMQSQNTSIRNSARYIVDLVRFCRSNDIELFFYGLKNEQKFRMLERVNKKRNWIHSGFESFIKRVFSYDRGVAEPEWGVKSFRSLFSFRLFNINNKFFLGSPFDLASSVLSGKLKKLKEEDAIVFIPFRYFYNVKRKLGGFV